MLNVVESGLETMGELVAIYQVSVECRRIEAGACFVEQQGGGEDGVGKLLVEHEVRKGVAVSGGRFPILLIVVVVPFSSGSLRESAGNH